MALELGVSFDIEAAVGKLDKGMTDLLKGNAKPLYLDLVGTRKGNGAMFIGSPPEGKIWNLLSVTTLGADDHTTLAGTVAIYTDCDAANLSLSRCKIPALNIPFMDTYTGTLWAHSTGDVAANVQGVTATDQVIVAITVAEWAVKDVTSRFV